MSRPRCSSLSRLFSLVILAGLVLPVAARAGVITRLTTNTTDETGTDAALDVAGNIHVVYERSGSLYYRGRTGTTWSAEELMAAGTNPAVGAGASGVPQVAFLSGGGVWFTARLGGTWMAPVRIGTGETVDLAVDAGDVGHVVYRGDYHGDGVPDIVYTNNSGGAFPPTPLRTWNGTDGGTAFEHFASPVIALDAGGHHVIAYHHHVMTNSGADWWTSIDVYMSATDHTYTSWGPTEYTNPYLTHNSLTVTDDGMAWVVYGTTMGRAGGGSYVEYPLPAGSSYAIAKSVGAVLLYLAYVDDVDGTGAVNYMLFTAAGLGAPFVADGSPTGRNPVVIARADAFVVREAVDSGDYEVWFQRITNQPPVLGAIGDRSVDEAASLAFAVSATDGDLDTLAYEASNLPPGAAFDPETRVFYWEPGYDQASTYTGVVFRVTDSGTPHLSDSETITITVNNVNRPPVLDAIGDRSVDEGVTLSFTVSAADPDPEPLTYGASNLPAGASLDPATGYFSWTPGYDQAGVYEDIAFTVADAEAIDSESITITVNDDPSPPGFYTVIPCRVLDTRSAEGPWGGPALVAGTDRTFAIVGQCDIPSTAMAISVNVTVTQPSAAGNLRLYPSDIPVPLVSTINYAPGVTRANNAIVPLSELGEMTVFCSQASGSVHFILDVNGYFRAVRAPD